MNAQRIHTHDVVTSRSTAGDSLFPCKLGDGTVCNNLDDYRAWMARGASTARQDAAVNRALGASDGGNAPTATVETLDGIPSDRKPKKPGERNGNGQVERFDDKPVETLDGERPPEPKVQFPELTR